MKSRVAAVFFVLSGATLPLVPACRCASSSAPLTDGATGAGGASTAERAPAASVSVGSTVVRRVNLRPNVRPLLLQPSAVRVPTAAPPPAAP